MNDCMHDAALLEADCAAEDRFVFTFARSLLVRVPVGIGARQARCMAQLLLDEAFARQVVPARLGADVVSECIQSLAFSGGLTGIVLDVLKGRENRRRRGTPMAAAARHCVRAA